MNSQSDEDRYCAVAEAVREACLEAARDAYTDAAMRGLCPEGAWETALEAVRSLDVGELVEEQKGSAGES